MNSERNPPFIIKLRGLPFDATASDILAFLADCNTPEAEKSVHLAISHRGSTMMNSIKISFL